MSELTQSLQIAVSRYPGTMAELARRTAIDRSTLYKIINGQRTPRQEQLERLAEALELNDEQKDTLLLQYKQRGRSTDPRIRTELHKLLTTACTVQESIRHEGVAPNTAFSEIPCTDRYVEGPRAVGALAGALIARHLASGDTRPLLLSPFTNPVLDNALIERFSVADGEPAAVGQLLLFAQDREIPRHLASDIATLTHTLPLLFLPKMRYDARIASCITGEPIPGALMPVYLLLPESALMMDRLGQKALLITDRKAVESLRLSFSRQYFDASSALRLTSDKHNFLESMALYSGLFARRKRCSMLRYQPPFTLLADKEMALQVLRLDDTLRELLPSMLDYLASWSQQTPDIFFCEEGILQFVRNGLMFDLPPSLYDPPAPEIRRRLLQRLRQAVAADRQTLRIVGTTQLPLSPAMSVNVFQGGGIVFCQAATAPDELFCREYLLEDPVLTDAMLGYLDLCRAGERVRSKKYTLDFIDYCLRLL